MQGKTHLAVGAAAALAVLEPQNLPDLLCGTGAALIGSVICDIDVGTSDSHEKADKVIAFSVFMLVALAAVEYFFKIGIVDRIMSNSGVTRIVISSVIMLVLCAYGKEQPHRTFMHSFLALAALTECVQVIFPPAALYFGVGFLSHMTIDFLNKKGMQLFYPFKMRLSLRFCSTKGFMDKFLRWNGTIAAIGLFGYRLYEILEIMNISFIHA